VSPRLFAGIPVPEPARTSLAAILEDLSRRNWPVRWVRPEGLHLTLKFFGLVSEETAEGLAVALGTASEGTGPIAMSCTGLGSFPGGQRARVVWMGLDFPGLLELLQDAVERACVPLGFPVEGRPFRPHITLGRVKEGEKLPANALTGLAPETDIPFLAERLVLFQSRPGRGGSVYTPRHTIMLTPCAAV
jgi:RNA 2',3'-cyclic 3'-phosphodiesterase